MSLFRDKFARARCPAAGSTRQALNRAASVVLAQYFPVRGECLPQPPVFGGQTCSALREELDSWKAALLSKVRGESPRRSLSQALKSCYRFFDGPCKPCDKKSSSQARARWVAARSEPPPPVGPASWSADPVAEVADEVRRMLYPRPGKGQPHGRDWAMRMEAYREAYLMPDQNGCLEKPRSLGGTLAVGKGDLDCTDFRMRLGVAKTKGKSRVVTIQSAGVKRLLSPVHDCLYDFISSWVVRGEFSEEHVIPLVEDLRDGEVYVSGDYTSATDNFHPEVTYAVAKVIARSPFLSEEERECVLGSFLPENLVWVSKSGKTHPIYRGQMMGNKLSFPMLCLINKAVWNIAHRLRENYSGKRGRRICLINGDDIAFCGDSLFVSTWKSTLTHMGMVLNEEKTGLSKDYIELNSKSFHVRSRSFVTKPVLSFFRKSQEPGCILRKILEGAGAHLRRDVLWEHCIVPLRHWISRRGVDVSCVPRRLFRSLCHHRWFRQALVGKAELVTISEPRSPAMVTRDQMPARDWWPVFDRASALVTQQVALSFEGRELCPYKEVAVEWTRPLMSHVRFRLGRPRLCWLWPRDVYSWWIEHDFPLERLSASRGWFDDHVSVRIVRDVKQALMVPPPPSLIPALRGPFVAISESGELVDDLSCPRWREPPPVRSLRLGDRLGPMARNWPGKLLSSYR